MRADPANASFQVVLAIEGGADREAVQNAVRSFARPLGYDRFVMFSASTVREDVLERIYWVEGDWFGTGETVDAATYVRRCPVTRHMLDAKEPFFWTKREIDTGELYQIVPSPLGSGIHGLQIPIFGPQGLEGAVSLGGERIDASAPVRLALTIIGTAAFAAARRLLETPDGDGTRKLSKREREILTWTAIGRRQADIAATLRLSERTVENHLRRIRRRLGVHTTAQAIRIAIRNGEIEG